MFSKTLILARNVTRSQPVFRFQQVVRFSTPSDEKPAVALPEPVVGEKRTGIVRNYNPRRGFGFIQSEDGNQFFVHQSQIKKTGYRALGVQEKVEFVVAANKRANDSSEPNEKSFSFVAENVTGPNGADVQGPPPRQFNNSRGNYNNARGNYNNQRGNYNNERGGYNNQRGNYRGNNYNNNRGEYRRNSNHNSDESPSA